MRRLLGITMALLLCLAATACGGDDGDDTSAKASSTTADGRATEDTDGSGGAGGTVDDADLEAKLLTLQDVGGDWKVESSSADDSDDDEADDEDEDDSEPECLKELDDLEEADSAASADVTFTSGEDDVNELSQEIEAYGSNLDEARAEFDKGVEVLDGCGEFTTEIDGTEAQGAITRVEGVSYGDRSAMWEFTLELEGFRFTEAIAIVFVDDLVVNFSLGEPGADTAAHLRPYIEKGLAKLAA